MTLWNILVVYGIRMMASGRAAILGYTMPAWGVVFAAWLLGERLTGRRVAGVGLGVAGMLLLLASEFRTLGDAPLGALLVIAAAVFWALGTVMMKRWPVDLPTTSYTAWQMVFGVVPFLVGAILWEPGTFNPFTLSLRPMLATLYNVFAAFIFCHWAWNTIVLAAPVGVSSLSVMMIPVVGVFSGMALLAETPHWYDYAALVLVIASLATVLAPPRVRASSV
jgi:drug/metabolite transporter (DMT)-like permease